MLRTARMGTYILASARSWQDNTVRLWNTIAGNHLHVLTGHTDRVSSVAFSPDGNTLASASRDGTVQLWETITGNHLRTLTGHTSSVSSVAFSPDGNTLASASSQEIRLWDAKTGAPKHTLTEKYTAGVYSIAFGPDGRELVGGGLRLVIGSWAEVVLLGAVVLWDAKTGAPKHTFTGHTDLVASVVFSPDGNTIVSGSQDGTVLLWELTPTAEPSLVGDVNHDGVVNILDLVHVSSNFGKTGQNDADVNGDGVVNIVDLVTVAGVIGNTGQHLRHSPKHCQC